MDGRWRIIRQVIVQATWGDRNPFFAANQSLCFEDTRQAHAYADSHGILKKIHEIKYKCVRKNIAIFPPFLPTVGHISPL